MVLFSFMDEVFHQREMPYGWIELLMAYSSSATETEEYLWKGAIKNIYIYIYYKPNNRQLANHVYSEIDTLEKDGGEICTAQV